MRGECGNAQREGEGHSCGAGVVAKIAGVGIPSGAAHKGGAHDADGERCAMDALKVHLSHAFGEEVGVRDVRLVQHTLYLQQ